MTDHPMGPDSVVGLFDPGTARLKVFDTADGSLTAIEATRDGFRMLAAILNSMAETATDDYWLDPNGPGLAWFVEGSTKGLHFGRLTD